MENHCSTFLHVYQRCQDLGVLFYTLEDRLVYYTLAAVKSKKHNVKVVAASQMFTHTHQSVLAELLSDVSGYFHDLDTSFSRLYNFRHSRNGRLFDRPTGISMKRSSKDKRSNIIYVYNNHVEKGLCQSAVEERWSLLAYGLSDHPFSAAIDPKTASATLKKVMKLVDLRIRKLKALEYADLDKILPVLNAEETEQFTDYVISRYALIDFRLAAMHFRSMEDMVRAVDSATGGEFQIREERTREKDRAYDVLIRKACAGGFLDHIFTMTAKEKTELALELFGRTGVSMLQIGKFLHLKIMQPDCCAGADAVWW